MLTFFKFSILVVVLVPSIDCVMKRLAVNLLTKPNQIRQEMQVIKQVARNNVARQEQVMRQAKIQQVGKPLAEKALHQGRNKPNIPVINKHHFKIKDQGEGYIQKIETGDQKMNRLAEEMYESQKNLYELMQEKMALRRAAREEVMKQKKDIKVENKNIKVENKEVKVQNKDLKIDNKDPINLLVENPTKNFNKETYQNFLEQSKKFDKYMKNQYPTYMVKPNAQDYQNFELFQRVQQHNLQNSKVYENVMQNLFKNEKENLQNLDQKKDIRIIKKEDLDLLKQNMPKDVNDIKQNQRAIKQFLKQKINLTQFFNTPSDVQIRQNNQLGHREKNQIKLQDKENTQIVNREQTDIMKQNNQPSSLMNIQDQQKGLLSILDDKKQVPMVYHKGNMDLQINQPQNTNLIKYDQGITDLIQRQDNKLMIKEQNEIAKHVVSFPPQLLQKEQESISILDHIKKENQGMIQPSQENKLLNEILGETNPIQHDMQRHQPMLKMIPNDISIDSEQFRKILRQNPSLINTKDIQYNYQYKPYMNKLEDDNRVQHSQVIEDQNDKEINLYPNYLKDQIKVNPDIIDEQQFKDFTKKDHFNNMINKQNTSFKPVNNLPVNNILPITQRMNFYMNPNYLGLFQYQMNMYRLDNTFTQNKQNLPEEAQDKINNYKDEFKKFSQDEQPYLQLLNLEEKCIEEFTLHQCGQLAYELTELYKSLTREKRKDFDYIRQQITNKIYQQDNLIKEVYRSFLENNLLKDLTNKFENMHGRLEYLLYDYRLN